jgi:hypothetical protein
VYVASPDGVNVAVYTAPEPAKFEIEPPDTVMSPDTRSVVDSLDVNFRAIVASLVVAPDVTPAVVDVIVIVGMDVSCVTKKFELV